MLCPIHSYSEDGVTIGGIESNVESFYTVGGIKSCMAKYSINLPDRSLVLEVSSSDWRLRQFEVKLLFGLQENFPRMQVKKSHCRHTFQNLKNLPVKSGRLARLGE
jgi:hypothetical protein